MSSNDRMMKFIGVVTLIVLVLCIIEYTNQNKAKKTEANEVNGQVVENMIPTGRMPASN